MGIVRKVILTSILVILACLPIGVFATWKYGGPVASVDVLLDMSLGVFDYKPEEVLPGGDDVEAEVDQNHLDLINNILHEASYGLNATKKPIIHGLLNDKGDVVYCEQNVQGGNLKHIMLDNTDAERLLFQIEYVSDSEYVTYTYSRDTIATYQIGDRIPIYKTIMKSETKNNKMVWSATSSYVGTAVIVSVSGGYRGIDSTTWVATT